MIKIDAARLPTFKKILSVSAKISKADLEIEFGEITIIRGYEPNKTSFFRFQFRKDFFSKNDEDKHTVMVNGEHLIRLLSVFDNNDSAILEIDKNKLIVRNENSTEKFEIYTYETTNAGGPKIKPDFIISIPSKTWGISLDTALFYGEIIGLDIVNEQLAFKSESPIGKGVVKEVRLNRVDGDVTNMSDEYSCKQFEPFKVLTEENDTLVIGLKKNKALIYYYKSSIDVEGEIIISARLVV
jgi:hypothetical protein